ncbi:hypothetical protein [Microseira wollei]|nr:hypothetical protein [Microseira wollei]
MTIFYYRLYLLVNACLIPTLGESTFQAESMYPDADLSGTAREL